MKVDTRCVVCQRFDEDGGHLFFKCKEVRDAWNMLDLDVHRSKMAAMGVKYIIAQNSEISVKIIALLWTWWLENNRREEGKRVAANIAHSSLIYAMEVIQSHGQKQRCKTSPQRRWEDLKRE